MEEDRPRTQYGDSESQIGAVNIFGLVGIAAIHMVHQSQRQPYLIGLRSFVTCILNSQWFSIWLSPVAKVGASARHDGGSKL